MYAFVLIDALPRREQDVYKALDRVGAVRSKRVLPNKVGGADIAVLLDAEDEQAVEHLVNNELRSIPWVHSVRRVMPHHTVIGPIRNHMAEMEREADAARRA